MRNKFTYSVKQVSSFLVQISYMCFVKYGAVLFQMLLKVIPKMIRTDVHYICRLISILFIFSSYH